MLTDPRTRGAHFPTSPPAHACAEATPGIWRSPEARLAEGCQALLEAAYGHRPLRNVLPLAHPRTLATIQRLPRSPRDLHVRTMSIQMHDQHAEAVVVVGADVNVVEAWTMRWERYGARWHCLHLAPLSSLRPRRRHQRLRP